MTGLLRLTLTEAKSQPLRLRGSRAPIASPASRSSIRIPSPTNAATAARFCLPAFNGCAPVDGL